MTSWRRRDIVRTMLPLLLVLSVLELVSGTVLDRFQAAYLGRPTLLVVLPVVIAMGGNLGALLSSRLSTGLHLGTTEFALTDRAVWSDVLGVVALALTVFAFLGVAATAVGRMAGGTMPLSVTLAVTMGSGMLLAAVVIAVSLVATYAAYRSGADPDDVVVPVVTNVCDASGILILTWVVLATV